MGPAAQPRRIVRFGVYELDVSTKELRKHAYKLPIQGQPIEILTILTARPRELVTREELREKLWPADTHVGFEHSLNAAVKRLRRALNDSADNPRFVETLPRRGYRFIAPVESVEESLETVVVSEPPADQPAEAVEALTDVPNEAPTGVTDEAERTSQVLVQATRKGIWKIAGLILLVAVVCAAMWMIHVWRTLPAPIRSLAVLPMKNFSGDPSQDYFSDGMTDELITELGRINGLRVISRTSVMTYKSGLKPLPQIAKELDVDAVVEGSVLRSGDRVRITAQLILASADKHLWAESYEGDLRDTLALQSQVARAIAAQIQTKLNPRPDAGSRGKPVNPEAYEDYLKGRYFWNKRTGEGLEKARDYFLQAIEKDPGYAPTYSGLADTYALLGDWQYAVMTTKEALPKAKAAAIKAIELDDSLGEAHTSLAFCLEGFDWDLTSAGREYRQAIALSPGYATAHQWYAWHLSLLGRNAEAIEEMKAAQSLDPLSLIINADLAEVFLIGHLYDEAIQQSLKTIDMDRNFAMAHNQLGQAYLGKGKLQEAIAELEKAVQLSGGSPVCTANLARGYAMLGRSGDAVRLLNDLKGRPGVGDSNAADIAAIYAALKDKDQAMAWLEKGYEARFNPGVILRPGLDPLRSDPRFQDLVRRMALSR